MKRNWKRPSKERVILSVDGARISVPKNRVKQFRTLLGVPKPQKKSLTRNQWASAPYIYE